MRPKLNEFLESLSPEEKHELSIMLLCEPVPDKKEPIDTELKKWYGDNLLKLYTDISNLIVEACMSDMNKDLIQNLIPLQRVLADHAEST